eukprot:scaffold36154_cov48-Prasinocladus_malaysianus.AAC.1
MPAGSLESAVAGSPDSTAENQQLLRKPRSSAASDLTVDGNGYHVPTNRVVKSSYSTKAKRVMEVRGYNASIEFLNKLFDMHLSANTGATLTLPPERWRDAVHDSLHDAVKESGLFQSNGSVWLCWSVVIICRLGGDGATKPSWLITSCSQGNGGVTLIAPPPRIRRPSEVLAKPSTPPAKVGNSEETATCIRFNGNSMLDGGEFPNMGQYMGLPDQGCRVYLQAITGGATYDTSSNSPEEKLRLTTLWETRADPVNVSIRSVMKQMVHLDCDETSM